MEPAISRGTTRNTTQRYEFGYPAVANSVEAMTNRPPTTRPAYDDFATPQQMHADCVEVGHNLRLERAAVKALAADVPSLHFDDYPHEVHKRDIAVSDAAARIANALHLHLD